MGPGMGVMPLMDHLLVRVEPDPEPEGLVYQLARDRHVRVATVLVLGEDVTEPPVGAKALVNTLMGQWVGEEMIVPQAAVLATLEPG